MNPFLGSVNGCPPDPGDPGGPRRPAPRLPWQAQQQRNLRYVALTRSRRRLVFVEVPETERSADVRDSE